MKVTILPLYGSKDATTTLVAATLTHRVRQALCPPGTNRFLPGVTLTPKNALTKGRLPLKTVRRALENSSDPILIVTSSIKATDMLALNGTMRCRPDSKLTPAGFLLTASK